MSFICKTQPLASLFKFQTGGNHWHNLLEWTTDCQGGRDTWGSCRRLYVCELQILELGFRIFVLNNIPKDYSWLPDIHDTLFVSACICRGKIHQVLAAGFLVRSEGVFIFWVCQLIGGWLNSHSIQAVIRKKPFLPTRLERKDRYDTRAANQGCNRPNHSLTTFSRIRSWDCWSIIFSTCRYANTPEVSSPIYSPEILENVRTMIHVNNNFS